MICSVAECVRTVHAKGFCKNHYQQLWATGSPAIKRPNPHGTEAERFWRYVVKLDEKACWEWIGFRDRDGYGKFRIGKTNIAAHRESWILHNLPIAEGLVVRHKCNNPPCVNPGHLLLGTHEDNMADREAAGNCPRGARHPNAKLTEEQALAIRGSTDTLETIAAQFGISESQAGNIRRGAQWRELSSKAAEEKLATPTLFDLVRMESETDEELPIHQGEELTK